MSEKHKNQKIVVSIIWLRSWLGLQRKKYQEIMVFRRYAYTFSSWNIHGREQHVKSIMQSNTFSTFSTLNKYEEWIEWEDRVTDASS